MCTIINLVNSKSGVLKSIIAGVVLACMAGCSALGGYSDFDEPDIELVGIESAGTQGMEARFKIRLKVTNPNSIPLDVEGMAYDVYLRDTKVLSGVSDRGIQVAAYSEAETEVTVSAGMFSSLSLIRDLMTNPITDSIPYRLDTKLSVAGLPLAVRLSKEGSIDLDAR